MSTPKPSAKILDIAIASFRSCDLNWDDIKENFDQCETDSERVGVLLRWMDQQCCDEEWKENFPKELLEEHNV